MNTSELNQLIREATANGLLDTTDVVEYVCAHVSRRQEHELFPALVRVWVYRELVPSSAPRGGVHTAGDTQPPLDSTPRVPTGKVNVGVRIKALREEARAAIQDEATKYLNFPLMIDGTRRLGRDCSAEDFFWLASNRQKIAEDYFAESAEFAKIGTVIQHSGQATLGELFTF